MRRLLLFSSVVALVLLSVVSVGRSPSAVAQEGTPAAECVAPALPPGTPTPMEEESSPAAAEEAEHDHAATPESGEAVEEEAVESFGIATPEGQAPADEAVAAEAIAGMENLIACVAANDLVGASALMTHGFIQNFLEVPTVYDVPATFEGVGPFDVLSLDNVQTYDDGTVSVDFVYGGFFNGPGGVTAERWYLVEEDGYLKVDNITHISMPEGVLAGAIVVEVTMVDYAFALSQTTLPADTPIIFRLTNASSSGAGHVGVVLTYPDGTTSAGLITGEVGLDASTGFFGALYLEPGNTGDFGVSGLAAGTYFLGCDVELADGTPHYELGMVAEFTVE